VNSTRNLQTGALFIQDFCSFTPARGAPPNNARHPSGRSRTIGRQAVGSCSLGYRLALGDRPDYEMPVIGHDAIRKNAQRLKGQRFEDDAFKRLIIFGFFKDCLPTDRTVEDMIHHCTDDRAFAPGHAHRLPAPARRVKKTPDPFFFRASVAGGSHAVTAA